MSTMTRGITGWGGYLFREGGGGRGGGAVLRTLGLLIFYD